MPRLNFQPNLKKTALVRYGYAVISSVCAVIITIEYRALMGIPFALNFVAVSASAWFGGIGPGICATLLSALLVDYFVLPPQRSFVFGKASLVQVCVVVLVSLFICLMAWQRERNRRRLEKSELVFRGLVESISEGFASFDRNWNITYINSYGASLNGQTPEQLIGRNQWALFPNSAGTEFEEALKAALSEKKVSRIVEFYPPSNKWLHVTAYPAQDGVSVLFHDVTEQMHAEERLRTADRLAIAGRLAATVSHEINNPLEAVGNLLYLAGLEDSTEQMRSYIDEAEKQLFRASRIAKQTLSFYKSKQHTANVSIASAVQDALHLFDGRYESRGVRITQQIQPDLVVHISPDEFVQVIVNLISNALDASPFGSEILVEGFRQDGTVVLRVIDAGPGVPDEIRARIFDAFFTTKQDFGTGLGLWVCKNIVERHKGTITVDNREHGSGAVFTLTFRSPHTNELTA